MNRGGVVGGDGWGAGVVKVSCQQSKGVKCLSCLFTVNDGFDSFAKRAVGDEVRGPCSGV